jgi:uncharacterized protein YqgC (DUF456 family)
MNLLILVAVMLLGLVMIPFGLPGTWIIAAAALGYQLLVPGSISMFVVIAVIVLALIGELLEFSLTTKYTKKYGGSRRASWGAIIGGMIGAFVCVPVPLVGPVIGAIAGAFIGAFVGAFVGEFSRAGEGGTATRVATGALIGRAVAAAMKIGIGIAMAAWVLFAAAV